jgi:nucleoside phosphorylase/5'-deoxynucleotidase YfbR-like HD superfamily hydrolase
MRGNYVTRAKYDFAVIVALSEEAEYFRDYVPCGDPFVVAGYSAWPIVEESWDAFGKGVLILSGKMGFERARASTAAVIEELKVRLVANIGIAGRVADWLSIGDVVVPRDVFDFTQGGKIGGDPVQAEFKHRPSQKHVGSDLVNLVETHLQKDSKRIAALNSALKKRFTNPALWPAGAIKVVVQPLACTPLVVANEEFRKSFAKSHSDIAALEMESAGVMTALEKTDIEFLSVRGVSDGADFHKSELELNFGDENRRFALTTACAVLESILTLRVDQKDAHAPGAGIYVFNPDQPLPPSIIRDIALNEPLFSKLVQGLDLEQVVNPIAAISRHLRSNDYREPIVLLGGKGAGKTTLMGLIQAEASRSIQDEEIPGCKSISVRISDLESWSNGKLDAERTRNRVVSACQRLNNIIADTAGPVVVLVDGLNQAGSHRTPLIADLVKEAIRHRGVRLVISTESEVELRDLIGRLPLNIEAAYRIVPLAVDHKDAAALVDDFAMIWGAKNSKEANTVLSDMKRKDVLSIDLFLLSLFFGPFRTFTYRDLTSLSQCYELYCKGVLADGKDPGEDMPDANFNAAAEIAYDILISHASSYADLNERNTAKLVSCHSSITSFLVAQHIINTLRKAKVLGKRAQITPQQLAKKISYVFPADVNGFTKQIMLSDTKIERDVIEVIKSKYRQMPTLGKSHFAYLAGRVRKDKASEMLDLLGKIDSDKHRAPGPWPLEARMLRRSIFISRSMLHNHDKMHHPNEAAIQYASILLSDIDEAEFNRGFHLEYYGDAEFDPDGYMASQGNGLLPCNKTFTKLMERITAKPNDLPPLIELLTVLSLVQVRNVNGRLRKSHRAAVLALLNGPQLQDRHLLPPNVRGYIERVAEDLDMEEFRLSTVCDEWTGLAKIERTGWLRRRRDALGEHKAFWNEIRIESVAEHLVGVLGLAEIFLRSDPEGEEKYDKRKVIEMILVHDLAESRLGDQLPKYNDPKLEEIAIWKYGAFETYRGIGDLWRVPLLLQEFNEGETVTAKIAKDLDRLQFILQARAYAAGMSEEERQACENASQNIRTSTVRAIEKIVKGPLPPPRFAPPIARLD